MELDKEAPECICGCKTEFKRLTIGGYPVFKCPNCHLTKHTDPTYIKQAEKIDNAIARGEYMMGDTIIVHPTLYQKMRAAI